MNPPATESDESLPAGISRDDFQLAGQEFREAYRREPNRLDVLSWLGERCVQHQRWDAALACFEQIPDAHPLYGHAARVQQGDVLLELSRPVEAEQQYRLYLDLEFRSPLVPQHITHAQVSLVHLLGVELRLEAQRSILQNMVDHGTADGFHTLLFCFPTVFRWNGTQATNTLERWLAADPENLLLLAARARYRCSHGHLDEALHAVNQLLEQQPDEPRVIAAALYVFHQANDWDNLKLVIDRADTNATSDLRSIWLIPMMRGHLALHENQADAAVKAYRGAVQLDPASVEAWSGLAQAARELENGELQQQAVQRVQALARIQNRLGWAGQEPNNPAPLVEIADICQDAGMEDFARRIRQCLGRLNRESTPQGSKASIPSTRPSN